MSSGLKKKRADTGNATASHKKKRLDISMTSVIDNIVFNKESGWAYYKVENSAFDFLSRDDQERLGTSINSALTTLMSDRVEPLECHLIVDSTPINIDAWREQIQEEIKWNTGPGYERFMDEQEAYLKEEEYAKKVTYLGINLGKRGGVDFNSVDALEGGLRQALDTLKSSMSSLMAMRPIEVSASEEKFVRSKEAEFFRTLSSGALRSSRCTSEEILLMVKRQLYPSMPAPYLDVDHDERIGPGDMVLEYGHEIVNKARWLEITQMISAFYQKDDSDDPRDSEWDYRPMTGYRACLTFSKFKKISHFPQDHPFIYYLNMLRLPFPAYARFKLYPSEAMKKEIEKKKKESKDEMKNIAEGTDETDHAVSGLPPEVAESLDDIQSIDALISYDKSPWAEGSYHVVVQAPTEAILRKYCAKVKQSYNDIDIHVVWSAGDQAKLFLEQMPGDKIRLDSFDQTTNVGHIASSGFNFSSEVGDLIKDPDKKRRID